MQSELANFFFHLSVFFFFFGGGTNHAPTLATKSPALGAWVKPSIRGGVRNGIPRIFEGAPDIVHDLATFSFQLLHSDCSKETGKK